MRSRFSVLRVVPLALTAVFGGAAAGPLQAQQQESWNDARVLELVRRARLERSSTLVDTAFRSYTAQARGYVYFFIDRQDSNERTLVKADQIALEVFWEAPSETQQRIVGWRDEKVLPTNIRYHIDHLMVVQDDFGDAIRIGDGDEVDAVMHPMAPGASAVYDFLLADSLTLSYGGGSEEVRVYEIRVRPKDPERDAFVGSVFVDRATAAIVRMRFTFTPASYVDPYLDYIRLSLDNARWLGKHWLPHRQELELRREMPELDFLAGTVIRARFEVGGYEFNRRLPPTTFTPRGISTVPEQQREAFPFERGLFDDLEDVGLAPTPSLEEVRIRAQQVLIGRRLSGLSSRRFHFRSFSDALRYNRAEGVFVGGGVQLRPDPDALVRLSAGYALGGERLSLSGSVTTPPAAVVPVVEAYWDELRDMGTFPGTVPVLGSLSSALGGEDYLDPYFVRGARLTLRGANPDQGPELRLRWERHSSAANLSSDDLRPVRPVLDGILGAAEGRLPLHLPGLGSGTLAGTVGRLGARNFAALTVHGAWRVESSDRAWRLDADLAGGAATRRAPPQTLFLLGGPGTLPGHDYRSFAGRRFWLARVEGTHPLRPPWVGIRAFAALGQTQLAGAQLPDRWEARDSDGLRGSVGAGLSLGWDVLRLDFARGLRDGRWVVVFSVDPRFHPWL